jgi:hypothetical protein
MQVRVELLQQLRRDRSQREVAQRRQRYRRANASLSARVFSFTACIRIHALTASPKVALVQTLRCSEAAAEPSAMT